ncbi:MAG: tRNA pseudouridine(55) synthase TruB [Spirochaetales bacterium]|nr:tRNA pseudouridine(55) synthase TruB [Spirochaetales bacterium]
MNGLILLNKPKGITSFSVLHDVKKKLGITRVGHTGTLDKFACGLLIVLAGSFTRLANLFLDLPKAYKTVICFGKETATLDPFGEVVAQGTIPEAEAINRVLGSFQGEITQVPPRYSAVHVNGKRAYHYALLGKEIALKARPITVHKLVVHNYTAPLLTLDVTCSKGTYIRALARDLAYKLDTYAFVQELSRYGVGPFLVSEAVDPVRFNPDVHVQTAAQFMKRLTNIGCLTVREEYCRSAIHGKALNDDNFMEAEITSGSYALFDSRGDFLALVTKTHNSYRYQMVVSREKQV